MVDDTHPLPSGAEVALLGVERAIDRLEAAIVRSKHGGSPDVWIALSEALYWASVADEELWSFDGYVARRSSEAGGHAVLGLRYARDLHTHDLLSAARTEYLFGRGSWVTIQLRWVPLDELPQRPSNKPVSHQRDIHYSQTVAGEPLPAPLRSSLSWLRKEFDARVRGDERAAE
jgi:hypothetical protein